MSEHNSTPDQSARTPEQRGEIVHSDDVASDPGQKFTAKQAREAALEHASLEIEQGDLNEDDRASQLDFLKKYGPEAEVLSEVAARLNVNINIDNYREKRQAKIDKDHPEPAPPSKRAQARERAKEEGRQEALNDVRQALSGGTLPGHDGETPDGLGAPERDLGKKARAELHDVTEQVFGNNYPSHRAEILEEAERVRVEAAKKAAAVELDKRHAPLGPDEYPYRLKVVKDKYLASHPINPEFIDEAANNVKEAKEEREAREPKPAQEQPEKTRAELLNERLDELEKAVEDLKQAAAERVQLADAVERIVAERHPEENPDGDDPMPSPEEIADGLRVIRDAIPEGSGPAPVRTKEAAAAERARQAETPEETAVRNGKKAQLRQERERKEKRYSGRFGGLRRWLDERAERRQKNALKD